MPTGNVNLSSHMEHGKRVVFYRAQKTGGVIVVRILQQRMLPERQAIDDRER